MKINQTTKITSEKVILVPYRKHHVIKYHEWMKLSEIQKLTASEPLTLEEEYQMQQNWQLDEDKLTFIVLRRDLYELCESDDMIEKEKFSMIGDVNVFIATENEEDSEEKNENFTGELEIMIPDLVNRGQGFGIEAVNLMINYCINHIQKPSINNFIVKINEENLPSIKMFEKLGFVQYKYVKVFQEVCLKLEVNEETFPNEKLKYFKENSTKFDIDLFYA